MEAYNLQTASTYINNVLLARGLLKGGKPIDFAQPENDEGGTSTTMARIINLVNDLVLRRDREAEHRENLATTIRTLRGNESQQTLEIGRLKTKMSDLTRSLTMAEAQERNLKTNLSVAEVTIRGLREQVQRMKNTAQQVRAQCANDIRKRDLEMQKLKSHLADRQRGKRDGLGVTTININPAVERELKTRFLTGGEGVNDPGYSLRQETTEFLTELCQNLSDENDTLITLARDTVQTLKELQGLAHEGEEDWRASKSTSVGPQRSSQGSVTALPASYEDLSAEMNMVLEHLRTLLTNPSFVPLEEVEVRDKEIKRLRESWEKMENRWKQAVSMMDGWHQRLSDGGSSVQADELQMGLNLHLGIDLTHSQGLESGTRANTASIFDDHEQTEDTESDTSEHAQSSSSNGLQPRTKERKVTKVLDHALKERNDNARPVRSPRKVSFTPGLQDSSCNEDNGGDETIPVKAHKSSCVTRRPSKKKTESKTSQADTTAHQMSVSEKLAAIENEARDAEQARKETENRKRARGVKSNKSVHSRRRSTLTNAELDQLMGVRSK